MNTRFLLRLVRSASVPFMLWLAIVAILHGQIPSGVARNTLTAEQSLTSFVWTNHEDTFEFGPNGKFIQHGKGWEGKSWRFLHGKKMVELSFTNGRKAVLELKDGVLIHWDPKWGAYAKQSKEEFYAARKTKPGLVDPEVAKGLKGRWTLIGLDNGASGPINFYDDLRYSKTKWFDGGVATVRDGKLRLGNGETFDISKGIGDELSGEYRGAPRKLVRRQ